MTDAKKSLSYKPQFKKEINIAILFLRIFVGVMMLTHAFDKIENFNDIATSFPAPLEMNPCMALTLITIVEFCCSVLLIVGVLTRLAALLLVFGMIVAAFFTFPGFIFKESELAIMYLGIYITLFITGGGDYVIDRCIRRLYIKKVINMPKSKL